MATKTFEELKQMAIQIRDEKANKQNTATRIGTQMLEHLNKLEQEYYNKENIDEQKKQTDVKFSELEQKTPSNYIQTAPDIKNLISNVGWLQSNNTVFADNNWKYGYIEVPDKALSLSLSNYSSKLQGSPAIVFLGDSDSLIGSLSYGNKYCVYGNIPDGCKKVGFSVESEYLDLFRFEFKANYVSKKNTDEDIDNINKDIEKLEQSVANTQPKSAFPYILQSAIDIKDLISDTGWVQNTGNVYSDNSWVNGKVPIPIGTKSLELNNWDLTPNASVNIVFLNDEDTKISAVPMGKMPLSTDIPIGSTQVHLSVKKNFLDTFKVLFLGYDSNEILKREILELNQELIVVNYINYSLEPIKRLNSYAYVYAKTFFVNEYTNNFWYSLYKLAANKKYLLEQKESLESTGILAGFISSEEDFVLGGKIETIVMSGNGSSPLQNIEIESSESERFLVVLGKTSDEYSRVQLKQEESTTKLKEKLLDLEKQVDDLESQSVELESKVSTIEEQITDLNSKETICCPDVFYAIVGQEFNLYYDSLIKGIDAGLQSPFGIYVDIQCPDLQNASNQIGVRRERMWHIDGVKLTSDYVGEHDLQITAYNSKGEQIDRKNVKIIVANPTPLSTQKYILCIGDSLTNNGPIVATMGQHFQDLGGTQPVFIGQRTTSGYKHEGYPGYSFGSFVTNASNYAYRIFDVPTGTNVSVNDKYSTNGSEYIIKDIRTEGLDNKLRLRCERSSGSTEPNQTGTLTKVSGSSSSAESIEYSAYEKESGNPFWDLETGKVNFTKYREKMGMSSNKFDLIIIMLGTNDCIGNIKDMNNSLLNAKKLIEAIFEDAGDYPTKVILQMTPPDANTISSWQVYSDLEGGGRKISYWTNLWNLRKLLYGEFTKPEWNNKVYLGQAALGLDRYYGYPYTEVNSSIRISTIKEIYHTNSVHPNNEGYQQVGDGYYLQGIQLLK